MFWFSYEKSKERVSFSLKKNSLIKNYITSFGYLVLLLFVLVKFSFDFWYEQYPISKYVNNTTTTSSSNRLIEYFKYFCLANSSFIFPSFASWLLIYYFILKQETKEINEIIRELRRDILCTFFLLLSFISYFIPFSFCLRKPSLLCFISIPFDKKRENFVKKKKEKTRMCKNFILFKKSIRPC